MKTPLIDLASQHRHLRPQLDRAIARVLDRGDFILGDDVTRLEQAFSRYCGCRYAVGVSSGTAALFLCLRAMGVKEGDEVIVPTFTFIATALAVSYTGARPVFVDSDPRTYNLDPGKVAAAVTRRTKAIIPVHLFGQPADMPALCRIARRHKLKLIEDAAQAHGAAVKMNNGRWQKVGAIGAAGCFSFYPSKNLGGIGDGGMVTTNDVALARRLRLLRDCGRVSKYEHALIGYNSRLDSIQAAVLRVKLQKLDAWNARRKALASAYDALCATIPGLLIPWRAAGVRHVYHVYAIRTQKRAQVIAALTKKGIASAVYYPLPLHLQKAYRYLGYRRGDFPVAEQVAKEILALPMSAHTSKDAVRKVAAVLRQALV